MQRLANSGVDGPPVPEHARRLAGGDAHSQSRRLEKWNDRYEVWQPEECGYTYGQNWCYDFSTWKWIYTNPGWKINCGEGMTSRWELDVCKDRTFDKEVWWAWTGRRGWHIHEYIRSCKEYNQWDIPTGYDKLLKHVQNPFSEFEGELVVPEVTHPDGNNKSAQVQAQNANGQTVEFLKGMCEALAVAHLEHSYRCPGSGDQRFEMVISNNDENNHYNELCRFDELLHNKCGDEHVKDPCYCLNHAWRSFWKRWWR